MSCSLIKYQKSRFICYVKNKNTFYQEILAATFLKKFRKLKDLKYLMPSIVAKSQIKKYIF